MSLHSLPLFHRIAGRAVVVVGEGAMAAAKRRLVERAGARCVSQAEAHHARLAFVALEDSRAASEAAERLRRMGLLVNVADRPELCDFTLPSVLERGPVLVAVSTGGASAGLAKQLRLRLEQLLPAALGTLAERLAAARPALRQRFPGADARRRALDEALGPGGALDPLSEHGGEAVAAWLAEPNAPTEGSVSEICLTSADPDDLTLRQARALGSADCVLYEPGVPPAIMDRARADAVREELGAVPIPATGSTVILRLSPAQTATSSPRASTAAK